MKKALIIGYGSIGQRHAKILATLGLNVSIVSSHSKDPTYKTFRTTKAAFDNNIPDYIIISNITSEHYSALKDIVNLNFKGTVLIEKPVFSKLEKPIKHNFKNLYIAYNLRFHPLLNKLKNLIKNEKILFSQAYVGQHLSLWRKSRSIQSSYSSHKKLGGGILLDLSHEFDYLLWLFGDLKVLHSDYDHISNMPTDVEDIASVFLKSKKCPRIQLEMNALDHIPRRYLHIITTKNTYYLDFIQSTLACNSKIIKKQIDRNYTFTQMHKAILKNKKSENACSLEQAIKSLTIITSIKKN